MNIRMLATMPGAGGGCLGNRAALLAIASRLDRLEVRAESLTRELRATPRGLGDVLDG